MSLAVQRGHRPPKQQRSRRTLERIVQATRELLADRDPRDVSLREIADAAEVSFSSLFARFASKEALLDHLHEELCRERLEGLDRLVRHLADTPDDIEKIAQNGFRFWVESARKRGGLDAAFASAARQHPAIAEREDRFQEERLHRIRRFVEARLDGDGLEVADRELDSVLRIVLAAGPEMIRVAPEGDAGTQELVDRLTELALRSVGLLSPVETPSAPETSEPVSGQSHEEIRDRVLDAAERVFDGRGVSAVPASELAQAAGVDESGIAEHFGDVRGVLHAALERTREVSISWTEERAEWSRWRGQSFVDVVRAAIAAYAEGWRRFGGLIRTVRLEERTDPLLAERHQALDEEVGRRIRQLAIRVAPEIAEDDGDSQPLVRAMATITAALRTAIDRPSVFALAESKDENALVDELTQIAMRYVGLEPEAKRGRPPGSGTPEAD